MDALWLPTLFSIPKDIKYHISSFLAEYDLLVLRCVCKEFRLIVGTRYIGKNTAQMIKSIVQYGSLELVQWTIKNFSKELDLMAQASALYGHTHIFDYLEECTSITKRDLMALAIKGDKPEFFNHIRNRGYPGFDKQLCWVTAAATGNVNFLRILSNIGPCENHGKCIVDAAHGGHLEALKFLCEESAISDKKNFSANMGLAIHEAASLGHLECLKFLREKYPLVVIWPGNISILQTNQDCITYLVEKLGVKLLPEHLVSVAEKGRIEQVQYLHENCNLPLGPKVMEAAIRSGNLACVRYIHENGVPFDRNSFSEDAASKGHIECLRYIHRNGGKLTRYALETAVQGGSLVCLQYLHENDAELTGLYQQSDDRWSLVTRAAKVGSIECLRYLYEKGFTLSKCALRGAVESGNRECIDYVLDKRKSLPGHVYQLDDMSIRRADMYWTDTSVLEYVAGLQSGALELLRHLHTKGLLLDSPSIIEAAAKAGNYECVFYLLENDCPHKEYINICMYIRKPSKKVIKREIVPF